MEDKESGPVSLKVASKDQTTEVFIMKSWKKVVGAVCMTTLVAAAVAGCIGGAGTIADPARTAVALNKYVKEAPFQDPEQSAFMTSIHVLKDDPDFEV